MKSSLSARKFLKEVILLEAMREELKQMIIEKSLKISDEAIYKLVSGRMSRFYFNSKTVTLNSRGMYLIGNIIFNMIKDLRIQAIGGLTFGADPISNAVVYTAELNGLAMNAFSVRKEPKKHGTMSWIEGDVKEGDRVVIVDDVITTGGSTITAVNKARDAGLIVVKMIPLLDRMEDNGLQNVKMLVDYVEPVFNIKDFNIS